MLIADDNHDSAATLALLLQLEGHQVIVAHDGVAALRLADLHEPDILLLDIGMPGLDGYAVASQVRARPWGGRAVLIAVTGWGQDSDKRQASAAGFNHHFHKPVDPEGLVQLVAGVGG